MLQKRLPFFLFILLSGALSVSSIAQQKPAAQENSLSSAGHRYFTDAELVTQDGAHVKFYSDLLSGKVVIINAFFSSCTDSCPLMSAKLEALQDRLGDHLGKDVFIESFSVDPGIDRPATLKAYAARFHARPGWLFLTGASTVEKSGETKIDADVTRFALAKLGQKVDKREDHLDLFMIGNEKTGLWTTVRPNISADAMMEVVSCVLQDTKDNKGNCAPGKH